MKNQIDAAGDIAGSFVKLLSYFRTNVEIRPEVFDVDEKVAIAEVFRGLRLRYGNRIKLYNSTSIPPSYSDSEMVKLIRETLDFDESATANTVLIRNRLILLECNSVNTDEKERLTRIIADFEKNNQKLANLIEGLGGKTPQPDSSEGDNRTNAAGSRKTSPPTLAGSNLLTAYLCVENVYYRMLRKGENGYWLEIKPVKAGGTTRVKTNLITDVFTGGNRVSHSGAALVQYNLYDKAGLNVLLGIVPDYIPFVKPKKIPGLIESPPPRQQREVIAREETKRANPQLTKNVLRPAGEALQIPGNPRKR